MDPDDYIKGRTQSGIESSVVGGLSTQSDSILLHSRIAASAAATPAIVADIKQRGWGFGATAQGTLGSVGPRVGFARLSTISNPPTPAEIAKARRFLQDNKRDMGPFLSGQVSIGILQLAQRAGKTEVNAFMAEIKGTTIQTANGPVPMAKWLNANPEWRLFTEFMKQR